MFYAFLVRYRANAYYGYFDYQSEPRHDCQGRKEADNRRIRQRRRDVV